MLNASLANRSQELENAGRFEAWVLACRGREAISTAVCWPCSEVALMGAIGAATSGVICPSLVGKDYEIRTIADKLDLNLDGYSIVDVDTEEEAALQSVELCRTGHTVAMMKGSLHTDTLMRAVLKDGGGMRTSRRISHVFIMEAPLYHRSTLFITDAAINIYPSLEDKVDIVQNAIDLAYTLGNPKPRVAILSAIETVNPKIMSTVDAAALCKMSDRGQITGAILDGPLALDAAVSTEAARLKGIDSPVAGQADILVVPDLEAGNMLAKELAYLGGARLAGIVMGAAVPIVLTSRADSVESRIASCAIASSIVHQRRLAHWPP